MWGEVRVVNSLEEELIIMAEQVQSPTGSEMLMDSDLDTTDPHNRIVLDALIEVALRPAISEEDIFRALAETLSVKGIGFAIALLEEDEGLHLESLYTSDGTSFVFGSPVISGEEDDACGLPLTSDMYEELAGGEAVHFECLKEVIEDEDAVHGNKLREAFGSDPLIALLLELSGGKPQLIIFSGADLCIDWIPEIKRIAEKISFALEIVRLNDDLRTGDTQHEWFFQASEAALMLTDADGVIKEVNQRTLSLLNLTRKELVGEKVSDVIPECEHWLETGWHLASGSSHPPLEVEFRSREGIVRVLYIELYPVALGLEGNLLLRITDLSERWRLEEMVRRLDRLKDSMAEHLSVGMFLQDSNGNLAHVNQAAAEMLGYGVEELLGEHWTVIVPQDQVSIIRKANMRRMSGESDRYEVQLLHKSGKRLDVLVSESPYQENNRYAGTFTFITDLTALRSAEEKVFQQNRELQRALDRLTALNLAASGAIQGVDANAMMQAVGDELMHLGMMCIIATLDTANAEWLVQYATRNLQVTTPSLTVMEAGETMRLPADLNDPWIVLLQSGEALYIENPRETIEGVIPHAAPFEVTICEYETCPRIIAPLSAGERLFGALVVCGAELAMDDIPAITAFSNHLSIALEKARLLDNTLVQEKLGKVLAEIAAVASNETDMSRLLEISGGLICDALDIPACSFSMVDREKDTFTVLLTVFNDSAGGEVSAPLAGSCFDLAKYHEVEDVLDNGDVAWVKEPWLGEPETNKDMDLIFQPPALIVPMAASGDVFGFATFSLTEVGKELGTDEMIFVQTGVEQISVALEKVRLAAEAEVKIQIDQTLAALVEYTLASRDVSEIVDAAMHGVEDLLPCHFICLTSYDYDTETAHILGVIGGDEGLLEDDQVIPLGDWVGDGQSSLDEVVIYQEDRDKEPSTPIVRKLFESGTQSFLSIPLEVQNDVIGALSLGSRQSDAFTTDYVVLAHRFADQLAVALSNAKNYENARRRAKELAALYDLALEISGELEMRPLLRIALHRATQLVDTVMGAVFLVKDATHELTLVEERNLPMPPSEMHLEKGQGLAGKVWEEANPISLEKTQGFGDPRWLESCYSTGAGMGVPLFWDGEVRGVLAVFDPGRLRGFSTEEAKLLERMGAQVSLGIENVEKHDQIKRRVSQLRVVNDCARRLNTILDQEQLYSEIVRRVAHSLNIELVVLLTTENDELVEVASYYLPDDIEGYWESCRLKVGRDGISGLAAELGEPILVTNTAQEPRYIRTLPVEDKVRSAVAVPLKLKGDVMGVLFTGSERLGAFDQTDVDALQALCAHISTSMENAKLYEETVQAQSRLAESETLRSLGLMTSGIAHDFNNLLSVIMARTELALKDIANEHVRSHLEQVIASAQDGGETIRRLQDFARTRKDTSDFIAVDLNEVALEAIELSRPRWKDQAQSTGIDIEIVTELKADKTIMGAAVQLREVLINLIFNAVEAMPEGGVITIRTSASDEGALLIVSDTGTGMEEDVKRQMFVPFFTTKPGGTGLGLSMVYGVIQRHGGAIDIDSHFGGGTTVTIWLPTSAQIEFDEVVVGTSKQQNEIEPVTILIVEDEDAIREGLVESFECSGHRVLTASNGEEGLERFIEEGDLDIVFTDLGMPKLSGWELIEKLRAIDRYMPIVILSGWGDEIDPLKVREYGIAKVIAKPFAVSELHSALYEVLTSGHFSD